LCFVQFGCFNNTSTVNKRKLSVSLCIFHYFLRRYHHYIVCKMSAGKNGFRSPSNCKCFYGQQYMYLLYFFFLYQTGASTSLRAYELTGLRSVKRTWKGSRKVYMYHAPRSIILLLSYLHLASTFTHNDICNQSSIVVVQRAPSNSQSNETSVEPLFACSLRAAKVKLGPGHSLGAFSRTTLPNRRWSTFTTPSI
jgi:hypothetical protein